MNKDSFKIKKTKIVAVKPGKAIVAIIGLREDGARSPIYGLDIETAKHQDHLEDDMAGLCPYRSEIRLVQISCAKTSKVYVFDMWHISDTEKEVLFDFIRDGQFIAHNAFFEAQHFHHAGVENINMHCTMIMYRMFVRAHNPYPAKFPANLQSVVKHILETDISKFNQRSDWNASVLTPSQIEYAGYDAAYTLKLAERLLPWLQEKMPMVYDMTKKSINPVARIMYNGMYFNQKSHKDLINEQSIISAALP